MGKFVRIAIGLAAGVATGMLIYAWLTAPEGGAEVEPRRARKRGKIIPLPVRPAPPAGYSG